MIVEISGVEKVVNFWCSLFGVRHAGRAPRARTRYRKDKEDYALSLCSALKRRVCLS
jgi:hypothetical protein